MRKQNLNKNVESAQTQNTNVKPLINNEQIFNLINTTNKIFCKTHANQPAKSICMDCKTFCCMIENCGQPHIYHSIENLEYLLNNQVLPAMNSLKQINAEMLSNKSKHLSNINTFKNNLKSFAVEEKRKVDEEYRKILQSVQLIYNSYMDDVNDFIDDLDQKFDGLHEKINTIYTNDKEISDINTYVDGIISRSFNTRSNNLDNQAFVELIAKDAKPLSQKIKTKYSNFSKFDFDKEIKEIKASAEREYPKSDKLGYLTSVGAKISSDLDEWSSMKKNKISKDKRKSFSKMKRMVSMRNTLMNKDNVNNMIDIDLDLFVRSLFEEINKIRKNPREGIKYLDEYVDIINSNDDIVGLNETMQARDPNQSVMLNETMIQQSGSLRDKIVFVYNYFESLINAKVSLSPFEWDNDLSNSAEDYLKQTQGRVDKEFANVQKQMKEIVVNNYYSNYVDIIPIVFNGSSVMCKIIINFFINEIYWDMITRQNIIFSDKFNVAGICGISANVINKITLIANFSYLNNN
jgi:hypothetical protein